MPTFAPRLAVVLVALSAICTAAPIAAQGTPAMATIYLKEGGTIQGQILNENDPNGVRVKSLKSGTTFLLKTIWIDSIVKAPTAPATAPALASAPSSAPAPVAPSAVAVSAPATPAPAVTAPAALAAPAPVVTAPVVTAPVAPAPAVSTPPMPAPAVSAPPATSAPVQSEPLPARPVVSAPVVDALDPPPAAAPAAPAAHASKSSAEKKPAKFSHWYVGGGASAPTGDMSSGTDLGYTGMLAYSAGVGKMAQVRVGGAGNYWSASTGDANAYDMTGTFDVLFGKRIPGFVAPYALLGGVGGVRNTSPPPGFAGYASNPLFGGRVGAGLNSRRIFVEASYQKVWVDGATMGFVPIVLGFRF